MDEIKPTDPEESESADLLKAWGLLMQALRDEKVQTALKSYIEIWKDVQHYKADKAAGTQIETTGKQYILAWVQTVGRYLLSGAAVWAIVHLGELKLLEPQALGVLLGGVVGSLFVQPRSVESKK